MKPLIHGCEALVVGTGAGGAVAGETLASAGVDTIIVEAGNYYKKEDHGNSYDGLINMYLNAASTITFGKPPISITLGNAVGGTTAINSSTCFRPPEKKVKSWGGPSWEELLPYMERVEKRIHVHRVEENILGGNWKALKRGCDKLGIEIKPLSHNVKDCKGRGICQYGCPEGAKQSTDISFIPQAISSGATLLTKHRVEKLIIENHRVAGVKGISDQGPFEIRANKTIISMGAMRTPVFLKKNKFPDPSGKIGKGLQIHPASRVVAEFEETINGHKGLPQGAFIDKWTDRDIMLEGIFLPPGLLFSMMPVSGAKLKDLMAKYTNLSAFGVMVSDSSTGVVRKGHFGTPFFAIYNMNKRDTENMHFGIARICEIYLAAGARKIYSGFHPVPELYNESDLVKLENTKPSASDFEIGAFHPLGTCPMGEKKSGAIVDFSLKSHIMDDFYIMDGSVIPGSLGVNPQITIMTLAMRAAEILTGQMKKN